MTAPEFSKHPILIADDEPLFDKITAQLLGKAGFDVTWVDCGDRAIEVLNRRNDDLAIVDLNMPGNLAMELIFECRRSYPSMPIVVLTGRPTLPSEIESVRLGILDYLLKPIEIEDLVHSLRRAQPGQRHEFPQRRPGPAEVVTIPGVGPAVAQLNDQIRKTAQTSANVLIRGESGAGKELVARAIHKKSRRVNGPFVVIDCSALPENLMRSTLFGHVKGTFTGASGPRVGLIQAADGGTAFFDEIGELPLPLQAKLRRVIQFGTFLPGGSSVGMQSDLRIVAARNCDRAAVIRAGRFRHDLFYRLAVLEIEVLALRDRVEDIALLGNAFLAEIGSREGSRPKTLSDDAVQILRHYDWPGNVRELRNVMERVACLSDKEIVQPADLPEIVGSNRATTDAQAISPEDTGLIRDDRGSRLLAVDIS